MKRNILEKFERINQIRQQYSEQLKALAESQCEIHRKVITEFDLKDQYEHRSYFRYDSIKIDEDGCIGLYEYDRCDHRDDHLTSIYLHPLILNGDYVGYETYLRTTYQKQAEKVQEAKQQDAERRKQQLVAEMTRIQNQLDQMK